MLRTTTCAIHGNAFIDFKYVFNSFSFNYKSDLDNKPKNQTIMCQISKIKNESIIMKTIILVSQEQPFFIGWDIFFFSESCAMYIIIII